jgi:uncharacterized protein YgiM (DUF1202 family)
VSAAYATRRKVTAPNVAGNSVNAAKIVPSPKVRKGSTSKVAVNVRTAPSLGGQVVSVIVPGARYTVLGWSNGWAHVRLASGVTGWVSGTVLGVTASAASTTRTTVRAKRVGSRVSAGTSVITEGVRVHTRPGIKAPVVTLVAAGTHVRVLGTRNGWTLVRLPNGTTGYVLGVYVR